MRRYAMFRYGFFAAVVVTMGLYARFGNFRRQLVLLSAQLRAQRDQLGEVLEEKQQRTAELKKSLADLKARAAEVKAETEAARAAGGVEEGADEDEVDIEVFTEDEDEDE